MPVLRPEPLLLAASLSWALSGLPSLVLRARTTGRDRGHEGSIALGLLGSALAVAAAVLALAGVESVPLALAWPPMFGMPSVVVDPLSAVFVLPAAIVSAAGAVYGRSYWPTPAHPRAPMLRAFYGLLTAAILIVVTARHGLLFLAAWEVMAVSAFFLVSTEHEKPDVRRAGWIYLVAAHVGALFLFAMVALLALRNGTYDWSLHPPGSSPLDGAIFTCGLMGFAFKSGIAPLHFWLPGAHANSPSHVSAMLSGVLLKTGVYGLLRLTMMLPTEQRWGAVVLCAGAFSTVYGIAMALGQADYKRMLAYSSIEHLGIIFLSIGLAMLGRSTGDASLVVLGLTAALLHVWNHALFKGLLFLGAGAVLHATGTRVMDQLGGLWPKMPRTAVAMVIGGVAAAGLPPLNGFASEWLLYVGLFGTLGASGGISWAGAIGVPVLALTGGLALATFTKLFGTIFLGVARTEVAAHAHEPAPSMVRTLLVLAGGCFAAALASPLLVQALAPVVAGFAPALHADALALAPLQWVSASSAVVVLAAVSVFALLSRRIERLGLSRNVTWDCGYASPTSRMQYTGRSFSGWLSGSLQPTWMRVQLQEERAQGLFPKSARFESRALDPFKERGYRQLMGRLARWSTSLRHLQTGVMNLYLLYILVTLLALFAWIVVRPTTP